MSGEPEYLPAAPDHACPWTLGQLLALHAIAKTAGHDRLAAILLDHSRQHETTEGTDHE